VCIYYEEGEASSIRQAIFTVEPTLQLKELKEK
jgi:hypothetical protein